MSLDIHPRFQNATFNSTNDSEGNYFTKCNGMYEGTVVWACFSLVCVLCGFPACVSVLWELLQRHRRGVPATPNDVYMLNLTVMDFVFLTFSPLRVCNYVFWYIWPIEVTLYFIYAFTMTGRPLFTTCICLDCYLAVCHPITYRARKGLTCRVLMSIGVWLITMVYGALYVKFYSDLLRSAGSVLPYVFTIVTIGICDFFILRALRSSDPGGRDLHPQKKKALQIIINSLIMTVIAYLPPLLVLIIKLHSSISDDFFYCQVWVTSLISTMLGSTVMPVLYLGNLGKLDCILPCRGA